MQTLKNVILSSIAILFLSTTAWAETINIYTGSGENTNTVNEGQVVINGKVMRGSSREMTPEEQRQLSEELNQQGKDLERDMENMQKELEGMFN